MMSQLNALAGGLSFKKAKSYYKVGRSFFFSRVARMADSGCGIEVFTLLYHPHAESVATG